MSDREKNEGPKRFDKIIKENRDAFFRPFVQKVLGITIITETTLSDNLHTTIERETDFIYQVKDEKGYEFILHLEFQSQNEADMVYRMAEYRAILQRKHKLPVKQYVIYLRPGISSMRNRLREDEIIRGFELVSLSQIRYDELIKSEIPQELLFAILCDFQEKEPQNIVRNMLQKLRDLSPDEATYRKYVTQLNVLSQLRKLDKEVYKQALTMPIEIDITQNYAWKVATERGLKEGRERGIKEGRKEGHKEGMEVAQIQIVKKALVSKAFMSGAIFYPDIAEFSGLSAKRVEEIHKEMIEEEQ